MPALRAARRAHAAGTATLTVTDRATRNWTRELRQQQDEARDQRILDLWLACQTQEQIAAAVGLTDRQVRSILAEVRANLPELPPPDSLQLFNLWQFGDCDERYGIATFPGRIPGAGSRWNTRSSALRPYPGTSQRDNGTSAGGKTSCRSECPCCRHGAKTESPAGTSLLRRRAQGGRRPGGAAGRGGAGECRHRPASKSVSR